MRPAFLDAMSWEMAEVYGAVTDQILINLAHYFPYYDASNFPRSSITYQADMLAQMGQVNKDTMRIIRRNLSGASPALKKMLEQVVIDSVQAVNPELAEAVKKGIFMPPQTPVVSPNQYRAFHLYYKQAADKLNLVNTVMLESTQQAYRATVADIAARVQATQTALDIGAGEVVTGVSAWNTATAHAIKRLQRDGITGFVDHGGHRWSAESYVAMDIRTTMFNTGRAAVWETNQNFGNDLYIVSYHNGARPLCYPWQSKVISSTDNARVVADLDGNEVQVFAQSETSYGEPAGLFGINCKHYPTPFIPGVSLVREGGQSEEENAKTYAESQQQRGLERKIREEKRDLLMLKEQGAPDELIKAQRAKIRQTDDDIDAFCDATGRARRQNREAVYTKREFPAAETYDVTEFERKQKEMIDSFYSGGGAQQNETFGQMTPNVSTTPKEQPKLPKVIQTEVTDVQEESTKPLKESLIDAYEHHRIKNGLTSAPYDPEAKLQFITADLDGLSEGTRKTVEETVGRLVGKYDTPLVKVATMDKQDIFFNRHAFAGVSHNYSNDTATMTINPLRCRNKAKMVARIKELRDAGYCAYVPDKDLERYVFTHEFGHSIMKITSETSGKNFVGADYSKLREASKRVSSIFNQYREEIGELEKARRAAERRFIMDVSEEAGEEAREIGKKLRSVKISDYSLTDVNEFFAEAFVHTEYGGTNPYALQVREIIDQYFLR
jgi:hypothetical protein